MGRFTQYKFLQHASLLWLSGDRVMRFLLHAGATTLNQYHKYDHKQETRNYAD